jgi:hypothetical protein
MSFSAEFLKASELAGWLSLKLHDIPMSNTIRNRVAGACFSITLEHQAAVLLLIERKPPIHSSAYALVRPVFESYVRGMWLSHCATDEKIENFAKGKASPLPDTKSLIDAVEKAGGFDKKQLSNTYLKNWSDFCEYTHTGSLQVQRWNTQEAVEPSYPEDEVLEVIRFTSAIAILAAISVASMANNQALAQELLIKAKEIAV